MSEANIGPDLYVNPADPSGPLVTLDQLMPPASRPINEGLPPAPPRCPAVVLIEECRRRAADAYLVRVGGLIDVVGGTTVPHGRYHVTRHFREPFGETVVAVESRRLGKKWPRVALRNCRVVPDYSAAFPAGLGRWHAVLGGVYRKAGGSATGWLVAADWIEENGLDGCGIERLAFCGDPATVGFEGVYLTAPELAERIRTLAADYRHPLFSPVVETYTVTSRNQNPGV